MDKKKILLASFGHLSCDINGGALPAILPYLRAAYGLNYQATAGLMFAYSCISSLIQPLLGLAADRFSKPWFLPFGVLLAGLGMTAIGWVGHYWAVFACIATSGIGAALFHPEGARFANRAAGNRKALGISIFSIGGNSGFVLGPLLAAYCLGSWGLDGTFVFAAISTLTAACLMWCVVQIRPLSPAAGPAHATGPKAGLPTVNQWRQFCKLTVVLTTRAIVLTGLSTFIPLYWASGLGQSSAAGAMALTFLSVCGIVSNILGGMLSDRFGCRRVIGCISLLTPPVVLAFSQTDDIIAAWLLLAPLGFLLYASFSAQVVLGQRYLARNIGLASGITLGLATSIGGITAPLLGWIADGYGFARIFETLAAIALIGAVFALLLKEPMTHGGQQVATAPEADQNGKLQRKA